MVLLSDIMDVELLDLHIKQNNVSARSHNHLPYVILNYTPQCQFERKWDDVTRQCRGLIYDIVTDEVIARPFPKFGNWDEQGYPMPPAGPALRMEKMDGSLGILYPIWEEKFNNGNGGKFITDWAVATRGSMHSEQAEWATGFYRSYMDEQQFAQAGTIGTGNRLEVFQPNPDKTYLFEIIYPENRIVVDYGEYKGLVLLDVIDNETGFSDTDEFDNCGWPEKVVRHPVPGFDSGQAADIPEGEEGFVFLWPVKNFRTKMKSADYIELHRLVSNLSEKSVWKALVDGKTLDQIKMGLPEEFHGFIDGVYNEIMAEVGGTIVRVMPKFFDIIESCETYVEPEPGAEKFTVDRREFALKAKDDPDRKYLFLILDGKDVYRVALQDAKPRTDKQLVAGE